MRLLYSILFTTLLTTSLFSSEYIYRLSFSGAETKTFRYFDTRSDTCADITNQYPKTTGQASYSLQNCTESDTNPNLRVDPARTIKYDEESAGGCSGGDGYGGSDVYNKVELTKQGYNRCAYECTPSAKPSDNAIWDEDNCKWKTPCTLPNDKVILESYTDSIQCQSDLNNFNTSITDNTGAMGGTAPICTGCFDSAGNWSGGIYYKPPTSCTDNGTFKENNTFSSPYVYCSSAPENNEIECGENMYFSTNIKDCSLLPNCAENDIFSRFDIAKETCVCLSGYEKKSDGLCEIATKNCTGPERSKTNFSPHPTFNVLDYDYLRIASREYCFSLVDGTSINSALSFDDTNPACEQEYCYLHYMNNICSFVSTKYKPTPKHTYRSGYNSTTCEALADGRIITSAVYIQPSPTDCPNTGFCFILKKNDDPNQPTEPDAPDANNTNPDLNSTNPDLNSTLDLTPLLESQNNTNDSIKANGDKIDKSNKLLESLKSNSDDILGTNQDIKSQLDKMNLDDNKNHRSLLTAISENNPSKSINNMNNNLGNKLNSINGKLGGLQNGINSLDSKMGDIGDSLEDGLFGDDPFADFNFTDGSESFSSLGNQASNSFEITHESNLFGLKNLSGGGIPEYSVTLLGTRIVIFEPSMLNSLPIDEIRSLLLFLAALVGFAQTFRTV